MADIDRHVENQIADHANADVVANRLSMFNEDAIEEIIPLGVAHTSFGDIELDDVLLDVANSDLIIEFLRLYLPQSPELRAFVKSLAKDRLSQFELDSPPYN